jgi:hypothetical protein
MAHTLWLTFPHDSADDSIVLPTLLLSTVDRAILDGWNQILEMA